MGNERNSSFWGEIKEILADVWGVCTTYADIYSFLAEIERSFDLIDLIFRSGSTM